MTTRKKKPKILIINKYVCFNKMNNDIRKKVYRN